MIFWENWAGLTLALLVLVSMVVKKASMSYPFVRLNLHPGQGKAFAATIAMCFVFTMVADAMAFGVSIDEVVYMEPVRASEAQAFLHLIGFLCCPLLAVSCYHLSDNTCSQHKIRFAYILFIGFKACLGTAYAATLLDGNDYLKLNQAVENVSVIADVLVLVAGTTNPLSERWLNRR